jgi:hypothetical protein
MILAFKNKLQLANIVEEKLKIAFQFSIFIEFLSDYLNHARKTEKLTCKDFIVRDICYFFCHKISTKNGMDGNYFAKKLKQKSHFAFNSRHRKATLLRNVLFLQ